MSHANRRVIANLNACARGACYVFTVDTEPVAGWLIVFFAQVSIFGATNAWGVNHGTAFSFR
jgi:hypothetical protein